LVSPSAELVQRSVDRVQSVAGVVRRDQQGPRRIGPRSVDHGVGADLPSKPWPHVLREPEAQRLERGVEEVLQTSGRLVGRLRCWEVAEQVAQRLLLSRRRIEIDVRVEHRVGGD
jgi:hypothetical protein